MLKYVVFDYGNTLVTFNDLAITADFIRDDDEFRQFSDIYLDRFYWDKLDDGTITEKEFASMCAERLPPKYRGIIRQIAENWYKDLPVIPGMSELLSSLKRKGKKLYLLSDISKDFALYAHNVEILKDFDGLVMSGPLGITKKDDRIFTYLLDKYGLNPEEGIFVDDKESNAAVSESVGLAAYVFDGDVNKLSAYLDSLG